MKYVDVYTKAHRLQSHDEGTWLVCDVCAKKFAAPSELRKHAARHDATKPYVCADCPRRFHTHYELRNHHPVHARYGQFSCGLCDKLFKSRRYTKVHVQKCSAELGVSS